MFSLISRLNSWLEQWLYKTPYVSVRGLGAYRVFFALYLLLFFTPGQETYLLTGYSDLPDSLYGPPLGPMMFFNGLPGSGAIDAGTLVLTLSLALVCIGWQTRAATAVAALALFWLVGVENSLGKLNESQTLTVLMLGVMVFSPWGRALSVDSALARRRCEAPPGEGEGVWVGQLIAVILAVAFASAGLEKLLGDWLSLDSHATEFHADKFLLRGDGTSLTQTLLNADIGVIWELADYGTVIFEVGFILAAFRLSLLRAFCAFALVFHALNYAILNIPFLTLEVMYALFLPWDRLLELHPLRWLTTRLDSWSPATLLPVGATVVAALAIGALLNQVGSPVVALLDFVFPFQDATNEILYGVSMLVVAIYVFLLLRTLSAGVRGRRLQRA